MFRFICAMLKDEKHELLDAVFVALYLGFWDYRR
jgi:hypothetical protein